MRTFPSNKAEVAKLETLLQKKWQAKVGNRNVRFAWISSCQRRYLPVRNLLGLSSVLPAWQVKSVRGGSLPGDLALLFLHFLATPKHKRHFIMPLRLSLIPPLIWLICARCHFAFPCLLPRRVLMNWSLLVSLNIAEQGDIGYCPFLFLSGPIWIAVIW